MLFASLAVKLILFKANVRNYTRFGLRLIDFKLQRSAANFFEIVKGSRMLPSKIL